MVALEFIGVISGIAGVWLTMKKNSWCFPVGLINVIISLYLFFQQKLYADSLQQLVYILLLIYGWMNWNKMNVLSDRKIIISQLSHPEKAVGLLAILCSTLLLGKLLETYTDATMPWLDSFATSCAFLAQYLIARKKIETWMLWLIVNGIYIGIYFQKELYLYLVLFIVYGILSVIGWKSWKAELNNANDLS